VLKRGEQLESHQTAAADMPVETPFARFVENEIFQVA
jgi:hypothetical protein